MTMTSGIERLSKTAGTLGHGWTHVKAGLVKLGSVILRFLVPPHEPVIIQKRDRNGNLIWKIYDPDSNQEYWFTTEAEVRQWFDHHYYYGDMMVFSRRNYISQTQQFKEKNRHCQDRMRIETFRQQLEARFRHDDNVS